MLSPPGARLGALLLQRPSPPGWASLWRASRIPLTEAMKGGVTHTFLIPSSPDPGPAGCPVARSTIWRSGGDEGRVMLTDLSSRGILGCAIFS